MSRATSSAKNAGGHSNGASKRQPPGPPGEAVKTWSFDSVGNRKYAVQIRKASNGNPCLRLVEGVPSKDGGEYRKFNITIWSEDFESLWKTLDEARAYMAEHDIRTPDGHRYVPGGKGGGRRGSNGSSGAPR